jgi:hypothetical protein
MTPTIRDVCTKKLEITEFTKAVNLMMKLFFRIKWAFLFSYFYVFFSRKIEVWRPKNHNFEILYFFTKSMLISLISGVDPTTNDAEFVSK